MHSGHTGAGGSTLLALLLALSVPALTPGRTGRVAAQFPPELRGRVVEAGSGSPVAGAEVRVDRGPAATTTAADGSFTLRGLFPGEHTLRVRALGYLPAARTLALANGERTTVRLELRPDPLPLAGVEAAASRADSLPADALVLGSARIRESGARDLGELVEHVPGVRVVSRGGPGSPALASIRGSSADQVLVLVDGLPVNSPLTGEADLSTLSLEGVERVVVLRGAGSQRWGGGAVGGVIAVERRTPFSRELLLGTRLGTSGEREALLRAGGGTPGGTLAGSLDARWHAADGDFLYDVPAVRGGGETRRINARSELLSLAGGGAWRHGAGEVRARADLLRVERGMPGPVVQPSPSGEQEQHRIGASLAADGEVGDGSWRASLEAGRQEVRLRDPAPPSGPAFDERTEVGALGAAASLSGELGPVSGEAGVEARRLAVASTTLATGAPDGQESLGVWARARMVPTSARAGWHLEVSPALRADWSSLLGGTHLSPALSLALAAGPVTWRLAVRSAFSAPSLADQFFQEGVLVRPNPGLEPERVAPEVEAGVDLRSAGGPFRARLSIDAYTADVRGMILWFPDFRFVWSPRNVDVRRYGGELRGRISHPGAGLALSGSLARSVVEYREPALDGQLPYRPEWTADLELEAARGPLRIRASAHRTGDRRTVPGSAANRLDSYWKLDLRAGGRTRLAGGGLEAWLAVENLLDRRASMLADYPIPGRSWSLRLRLDPFSKHSDPR